MKQDMIYQNIRMEETTLKDQVYHCFDEKLRKHKQDIQRAKNYIKSGAYEDSAAASAYSALDRNYQKERQDRKLYQTIYPSPYFSHMELLDEDGDKMQIMLSDAENLNDNIHIDDDKMIIPFKNDSDDKKNQLCANLYHAYQEHDKAHVFYLTVEDRLHGGCQQIQQTVQLIRSVDIKNCELKMVTQHYPPLISDESRITEADGSIFSSGDELLEQKLEENRENAKLRNIIATLQREQFDIIQTPLNTSFVVQGCAGSGKTQCLIHRLFFFRDQLNHEGWEKLLLITPSQLFRSYSMELMRRFHLSSVDNCSIANLYCTLLDAFDPRFKKRQYRVELSEEYLPDGYLHQIYQPELITRIRKQIQRAIGKHTAEACQLLHIETVPEHITTEYITSLIRSLDEQITEFDRRASEAAQDTAYQGHLDQLDAAEKSKKNAQQRILKLQADFQQLEENKKQYDALKQQITEAETELTNWQNAKNEKQNAIIKSAEELKNRMNQSQEPTVEECVEYSASLFELVQSAAFSGQKLQGETDEYEEYLKALYRMAHEYFSQFLGCSEANWLRQYDMHEKNCTTQLQANQKAESEAAIQADECRKWLEQRNKQNENIDLQRKAYRERLENVRYYLSRIESSVFEQEIWNTVEPIKKAYGVSSVDLEELGDGHRKQTRILYKSDLLFYLHIYAQLYPSDALPAYQYICIDEGQDLHHADYDMLHTLYPNAVFNVFGDTMQLLHESCGVTSWKRDTGIETIFRLDKNYRNVPAIVNFCNQHFGSNMEYIGNVQHQHIPIEITQIKDLQAIIADQHPHIIVKNRETFEQFCQEVQMPVTDFEYLDLNASAENSEKQHCYSIFAAKGLEFSAVLVYARDMTDNQKIVASTRAMEHLYYYE